MNLNVLVWFLRRSADFKKPKPSRLPLNVVKKFYHSSPSKLFAPTTKRSLIPCATGEYPSLRDCRHVLQALRTTGLCLGIGAITVLSDGTAHAQTVGPQTTAQTNPSVNPNVPLPNPITPREPTPPPQTLPPPSAPPSLEPLSPNPPASDLRPDLPGTVTVKQFEFSGNTAFKDRNLAAVTAPFTQRPITFAELLQAEAAVTKRYVDAGFINSGAVIEANQVLDPKAAVVKVRIVEGSLEDIKITGLKRLRSSYVRSRLKLASGPPFNQNRLLKALQLLQLDPLIQTISADLSAGTRPETGVLTVKIKEAKSFRVDFFANNNRTPSVGSFRRGVRVTQGNLLGFGDGVSFAYENTDGSNAFDLSYTVPVNPQDGTVTLSGGISTTKIIEAPFDALDIRGNFYEVNLSFRQPLIRTPSQEFALGFTASRQESRTKLLGFDFPVSPGADANGITRTFVISFFQDWTQHSSNAVIAARSQFNVGTGAFDSTINSQPPDSRFFSWRGQAQYVRLLARDTLLVLRSDLQLSPDALVPIEQFALGGQQSGRGYRQDALLTDNGFFSSAEVRVPLLRVSSIKGVLQLAPFIDLGVGWNNTGNTGPNRNTLLGVGVGLQWQMLDSLTARFDWGFPLLDLNSNGGSLQEQGLYFSLNYSLF